MNDIDDFVMLDEFGNEKKAQIITVIEVDNKEYVIYSVEKDENEENIFVSRIDKDENDNQIISPIENIEEKEKMTNIVKELLKDFDKEN